MTAALRATRCAGVGGDGAEIEVVSEVREIGLIDCGEVRHPSQASATGEVGPDKKMPLEITVEVLNRYVQQLAGQHGVGLPREKNSILVQAPSR